MAGLNRRDFLKALGLTGGAGALTACGLDDNRTYTPIEKVIPYVVRPEQVTPGTPTFFATTVQSGPHAAPVTARHRDGRVITMGANTQAGVHPGVHSTALFEMQRTYSPDRIQQPAVGGAAASWEDALKAMGAEVQGKSVAYLGPYRSGSIVSLINDFTQGKAYFWEPLGYEHDVAAAEAIFGVRAMPYYDPSKADYVLNFGSEFLSGWGDSDLEGRYGKARNPNIDHKVVRFAHVSPHRGHTGASADDYYAVMPGSETLVALAVAKLVAEKKHYSGPALALLASADVAAAASASGLSADDIEAIATQFAAMHGLAMPGGTTGGTTDLAAAVYLLNVVGGAMGHSFGLGGYNGPISSTRDLELLVADINAGRIQTVILDDVNPAFSLPKAFGLAEALGKVTVISVSSHKNETNAGAKIVLPVADPVEDWGDEEPVAGFHIMRQPAMTPLYGNVSLGDVLLTVGKAVFGVAEAAAAEGEGSEEAAAPASLGFGPANWLDYLKATWKTRLGGDFDKAWVELLQKGVKDHGMNGVKAADVTATSYDFQDKALSGEMQLVAAPHINRRDGRYANEPWAQETPDPTTGYVWDTWLEINPATAEKMGLASGDLVSAETANGSIQVGVHVYKGIHPNVVAIQFGNGHTGYGRYADGYGVNPVEILGNLKDSKGALRWQQGAVTVKSLGQQADLVTTYSKYGESDEKRLFGVAVNADQLAKTGDAESAHPGDMTGIHLIKLDDRLTSSGIDDFYGMPDHPVYRFGMTVDTNACNGCGACVVACYAENNLPVVGKDKVREGREMGWIRIDRFWEEGVGGKDDVRFVPLMCQHCGHAGCESVCPVLATYHTIEGLNAMVYNRCAGTRYCSNACPYSARKFNYHSYAWPEPFNLQLNPDVVVRTMGVMEKCTFCVQRIRDVKSAYRDMGFTKVVPDAALQQLPACAEACPTQAMTFGNLNDEHSVPASTRKSGRHYEILGDLNAYPAVNYLAKANFHIDPPSAHHGGGHGAEHGDAEHGDAHGDAAHGDDHGEHKSNSHEPADAGAHH